MHLACFSNLIGRACISFSKSAIKYIIALLLYGTFVYNYMIRDKRMHYMSLQIILCFMQILMTVLATLVNITVQTSLEDINVPAIQATF